MTRIGEEMVVKIVKMLLGYKFKLKKEVGYYAPDF
jgi:hypothetical protein